MEMPNNEINNEFFVEVEKIMEVVEKMGADVEEVKRTQSAILSSPSTDESKSISLFFTSRLIALIHLLTVCTNSPFAHLSSPDSSFHSSPT